MRAQLINRIGTAALALVLCACQKSQEVIRESLPGAPRTSSEGGATAPAGNPSIGVPTSNGGGDLGGGNAIEGEVFDKRRSSLTKTKEYSEIIAPFLQKIGKISPRLAADMIHIAHDRGWFFLNAKLDILESWRIGIDTQTQQAAIHRKGEILLSLVEWNQMTPENQFWLLIHELVMGVRFMEFQREVDHCLAKAALTIVDKPTALTDSKYIEAREACHAPQHPLPEMDKPILMSGAEKEQIHELTHLLITQVDQLKQDQLEGWIKTRGFRNWPL